MRKCNRPSLCGKERGIFMQREDLNYDYDLVYTVGEKAYHEMCDFLKEKGYELSEQVLEETGEGWNKFKVPYDKGRKYVTLFQGNTTGMFAMYLFGYFAVAWYESEEYMEKYEEKGYEEKRKERLKRIEKKGGETRVKMRE